MISDPSEQSFWAKLRERFDLSATGQLFVCSVLIGVFAGLGTLLFFRATTFTEREITKVFAAAGIRWVEPEHRIQGKEEQETEKNGQNEHHDNPFLSPGTPTEEILGLSSVPKYWLLVLLIPAFGGLVCGILIHAFAPDGDTEGTDWVIRSFHQRSGVMRLRLAPIKGLASVATLGSGGSGGWEGPTALIGAGVGAFFSKHWKLDARERRLLLLAGVAGGIGAIFQSPFGGALFAAEVLYCSTAIEISALLPCIIASMVGYATFTSISDHPSRIALTEPFTFHLGFDIPWLLLLCLCSALIGMFFVKILENGHNRFFERLSIPSFLKPALGGLLLGCIALFLPQVRGGGYDYFQVLVEGQLTLGLVFALLIAKMFATMFTLSSGGSGGRIVPSLFIGGLLGCAFAGLGGHVCRMMNMPELAPSIPLYTLISMGAFCGSIGKIPLTATVLVCDMTGSYSLLGPILACSLIQVALHSPRTTLFREQMLTLDESPAHLGDFSTDILRGITVHEALNVNRSIQTINAEMPLSELVRFVAQNNAPVYPVVDLNGLLLGLVSSEDVRSTFQSYGFRKRIVASDLAHFDGVGVVPEDSLETALRLTVRFAIPELPVVDSTNQRQILGILSKADIIKAYHDRLIYMDNGDDVGTER